MSKALVVIVSAILVLPLAKAYCQNENIYFIQTENSASTGFRVQGIKGIITSLHSVTGCKTIRSSTPYENRILKDSLKIIKVDFHRDLAILSSSELDKQPDNIGLTISLDVDFSRLTRLAVIGYPIGIDIKEQRTSLEARIPSYERLADIVDPATRSMLKDRNSPSLETKVINLQGFLLPGHSGAPILDENDKVIGVGCGGLRDGSAGHGWAVTLRNAEWLSVEDTKVAARIEILAKKPKESFFAIVQKKEDIAKLSDEIRRLQDILKAKKGTFVSRTTLLKVEPTMFGINNLGTIVKGTQVTIVESKEDPTYQGYRWYHVQVHEGELKGKKGWLSGENIEKN
jgi:hypothetical protein